MGISFLSQFSQFSCSVMSDSLWSHELQHARPPCPSPTPGVHPDSRPSSQWGHLTILSSVIPFSSCPQSLPSIRVFSSESVLHMRWPKYWSFSFSIIPSKEIPGLISFRMDWLDLLAVLLFIHSSANGYLCCLHLWLLQIYKNSCTSFGETFSLGYIFRYLSVKFYHVCKYV